MLWLASLAWPALCFITDLIRVVWILFRQILYLCNLKINKNLLFEPFIRNFCTQQYTIRFYLEHLWKGRYHITVFASFIELINCEGFSTNPGIRKVYFIVNCCDRKPFNIEIFTLNPELWLTCNNNIYSRDWLMLHGRSRLSSVWGSTLCLYKALWGNPWQARGPEVNY